jgi:hypothetical protein
MNRMKREGGGELVNFKKRKCWAIWRILYIVMTYLAPMIYKTNLTRVLQEGKSWDGSIGLTCGIHMRAFCSVNSCTLFVAIHSGVMAYCTYSVCFTERKGHPITGLDRPWGFQGFEAPIFQDSRHMKVVRFSALNNGRLYPPGNIPGTHIC